MLLPKYIYFALTKEEVQKGRIFYPKDKYDLKQVTLDIISLRRIIKDFNLPCEYYTMIELSKLKYREDIYLDQKYNGIAVELPIDLKLNPLLIFPLNRLYHGSPTLNIKNLQTKPTHLFKNTNVVFAGERWVGISNVARWTDNDIIQGVNNNIPFIREARKNAFREVFGKGGYLYEVNKDLFTQHSLISVYEYYSKFNAPILKQTYIINPLAELIKMGVNVTTYNNIRMEQW